MKPLSPNRGNEKVRRGGWRGGWRWRCNAANRTGCVTLLAPPGRGRGSAGVTRMRMFIIAGCTKCANSERSLDKHNWNIYPNKLTASPQARKGPQLSLITSHSSRSGTVHHDPRRITFFMGHHASVRCPILWRNYLAKQSSRAVTSADIKLILQFCNKMKLRTGRLVHDLYSAAVRALRWPGGRSRRPWCLLLGKWVRECGIAYVWRLLAGCRGVWYCESCLRVRE